MSVSALETLRVVTSPYVVLVMVTASTENPIDKSLSTIPCRLYLVNESVKSDSIASVRLCG